MSELYPGSKQIPLMKYNGHPSQSTVDRGFAGVEYVAQEKKDGALYMLEKIDQDHIYLFARTISKKTGELVEKSANVPHIIEWAKKLPDETILLGEVYIPGGHSNDITKIMGCTPQNAQNRQYKTQEYGGPVHYYIFDCLFFEGQDLLNRGFIERYTIFQRYVMGYGLDEYIELAPTYTKNFDILLKNIFDQGGEGMVFKKRDAIYEPGKRPTQTYFKVKEHIDSLDLVCIGLEEPTRTYTGKEIVTWPYWIEKKYRDDNGTWHWADAERNCYEEWVKDSSSYEPVTKPWLRGWKNAITLGIYKDGRLISVGRVASGLTDEIREDMSLNPDKYLNHVVQVSCMSVNKKDLTLRHCVFEQMREDKNPEDCLYEEVFK